MMFRILTVTILTGTLVATTASSEDKAEGTAGFSNDSNALKIGGWTEKAAHLDHLRRAVEHLEAAGLSELAAKVEEHAETEVLRSELAQKRKELQKIHADIDRLERLLNGGRELPHLQQGVQVMTQVEVYKLDLTKLDQWGLSVGEDGFGGVLFDSVVESGDRTLKMRLLEDESVMKLLDWLRDNEAAKIVAEPTLVTTSGKWASFFSGGQVPVITRDGEEYSINYRHIGTQLELLPHVLEDDKVRLEIRPTLSRVVPATFAKKLDGNEPDYESRSFNAKIEIQAGQTVAIGGIIEREQAKVAKPRPLPKTGGKDLKEWDASKRTEYIFLITPQIVDAQAQNSQPKFIEPTTVPRALSAPKRHLKSSTGN